MNDSNFGKRGDSSSHPAGKFPSSYGQGPLTTRVLQRAAHLAVMAKFEHSIPTAILPRTVEAVHVIEALEQLDDIEIELLLNELGLIGRYVKPGNQQKVVRRQFESLLAMLDEEVTGGSRQAIHPSTVARELLKRLDRTEDRIPPLEKAVNDLKSALAKAIARRGHSVDAARSSSTAMAVDLTGISVEPLVNYLSALDYLHRVLGGDGLVLRLASAPGIRS